MWHLFHTNFSHRLSSAFTLGLLPKVWRSLESSVLFPSIPSSLFITDVNAVLEDGFTVISSSKISQPTWNTREYIGK